MTAHYYEDQVPPNEEMGTENAAKNKWGIWPSYDPMYNRAHKNDPLLDWEMRKDHNTLKAARQLFCVVSNAEKK